MRTGRLLIGIVAAALAGVLGAGAPAFGHNSLTGSDPADGETVERAPEQVQLTFLARLDPANAELAVTGPDGEPVDVDQPVFDGSEVTIALPAGPAGNYRVDYRVLSADGDWADGTVRFTVTTGTQQTASPTPAAATSAPATLPPPDPAAASTDRDDRGGSASWWPWLLAALALAAAAAGLVTHRLRRRRTSS
ncbi:MAG: copper resistance CopC family protein [Natronosporangium sp.]